MRPNIRPMVVPVRMPLKIPLLRAVATSLEYFSTSFSSPPKAMTVLITLVPLSLFLLRRVPITAIEISETESQSRSKALRISPRSLQLLLAIAGLSCCIAMSMPQVHIVSFCMDLGYGPAVGAEMLSLMLFGGVVSRLFSGLIADWIGGIKTVLIPIDNKKDLAEIPDNIKNELEIIPVSMIDEVISNALVSKLEALTEIEDNKISVSNKNRVNDETNLSH